MRVALHLLQELETTRSVLWKWRYELGKSAGLRFGSPAHDNGTLTGKPGERNSRYRVSYCTCSERDRNQRILFRFANFAQTL
jgi:hypothetical protein